MKILVTGSQGQVGAELCRSLAPLGTVVGADRGVADLSRPAGLGAWIDELAPDVIVNAAAYTAVDRAEDEEDLARCINADAVGAMARAARSRDALFVHFSTDYVFDGQRKSPYAEGDDTAPLNAYGRSKLAGEQAVQAAGGDWLTFRTSWVYGARGRNFLRTMLTLARQRESLKIVADQAGAPTSARMIADLVAFAIAQALAERRAGHFASGLFHMTARGQTTWHGFATAIIEAAREAEPDQIKTRDILPIGSAEYPTPARRPQYSMLDNTAFDRRFALHRLTWRDALAQVMADVYGCR